jgi:hypothetical protein
MKLTEQQIAELAAIFDDVITSDSVAVQSAFQRLALLSSLARQEKNEQGPFVTLLKKLDWAEHELKDLRREVQILQSEGKFTFSGEPTVIDLSNNMASSTFSLPTINTITLSQNPTIGDDAWLSNISISGLDILNLDDK